MSNVAKLKKKAAEFEQKKQFDKALALYVQILESNDSLEEEADVALYNRVGDLLLRHGGVGDAVNYYEKAVDLYAEGGFFNNAIALCNKILRHSPGRASIYYKLGKISAKKGFKSDAKQNFLEYADRMQKAGQIDEAFRALKEFADLCPDQDDIRLMLAEQLSRKDRKSEAMDQLQTLYDKFHVEGRSAEARATAERMRAIDPTIEPKTSGTPPQAKASDLVFLDVSYDDPRDLAARTAPTPVHPMPAVAPPPPAPAIDDIELPFLDTSPPAGIARAHDEPDLDGPSRTFPPLGLEPTAFDGGDATVPEPGAVSPLERPWTPARERPVTPLAPFAQHAELGDDAQADATAPVDLSGGLLSFDAAPAAPLTTSQFGALDLSAMEPTSVAPMHAHDLALPGELPPLDLPEEDDGAGLPLASAADATPSEPVSAQQLSSDDWLIAKADSDLVAPPPGLDAYAPPDEVSAPDFGDSGDLDFLNDSLAPIAGRLDEPADAEDEAASHADEGSEWSSPETPGGVVPWLTPAAPAEESHVVAGNFAAPPSGEERDPGGWAARRRGAEALLDAGDRAGGIAELDAVMLGSERENDVDSARSVASEIIHLDPNSVRHHQKRVEYAFRANDKLLLADAYLELADSLFRGAQPEMARAVYQRVLELTPDDSRAQAALTAFPTNTPPGTIPVITPGLGVSGIIVPAELPLADPSPQAPPAPEPTPARPAERSAPPAGGDNEFVNLADWLREDEPPKSTRMIAEDEQQDPGREQADFGEMLRKFKQGVAANVGEEDHESHYDLGVAYKEMGLVDEAIGEFQKALRSTSHRVRAFEALGQCFLEKSQFQVAHTLLNRALAEPGADDQQLVGVLYLLGYATEAMQRFDEAIGFYQRVFAVDIAFRDVSRRLSSLERVAK